MCYLLKDQGLEFFWVQIKLVLLYFLLLPLPLFFFLRKKKEKNKNQSSILIWVLWFSRQGIMSLYCQPNQVWTFSLCLPDSYLLMSLTCFSTWLAICLSHLLWCISLDSFSCDYLINNSILYESFRKSSTAAGQTRMWCWAWIWSSV